MRARITTAMSILALTAGTLFAPSAASAAATEYVATVKVTGGAGSENYRIHLVEAVDIAAAFDSLSGASDQFPNGLIDRSGPEYNVGYSWHIDPNDVEFADFTIELCDGLPSDVENGTLTSDRYCPWSGRVVAMTPLP
jgi:hypothetical protein